MSYRRVSGWAQRRRAGLLKTAVAEKEMKAPKVRAKKEVAKQAIVLPIEVRAVLNDVEIGKRRRGAAWVWNVSVKMKEMPETPTVEDPGGPGETVHEGVEGVGGSGGEEATAGWTLTAGSRTDGRKEDRQLRLENGT